jgi:hypothetical protein
MTTPEEEPISPSELEEQEADLLPEREAMSTLALPTGPKPDIFLPPPRD